MFHKLNLSLLMILFGVFLKEILLWAQRGCNRNFIDYLGCKKHGHISFRVLIAWFSERLTPATNFSDFQHLSLLHFLSFYCPIFFLLRFPLAGFQSNGLFIIFIISECLWREEIEIIRTKPSPNCPQCDVYS